MRIRHAEVRSMVAGGIEDEMLEEHMNLNINDSQIRDLLDEVTKLNARIADLTAAHATHARVLELDRETLRAQLAEARAALVLVREVNESLDVRAERAETRVGELENACKEWQGAFDVLKGDKSEDFDRAERAEAALSTERNGRTEDARRYATYALSAHIDKGTLQALRDANDRAERAEAECAALREALLLMERSHDVK